MKRWLPIATIAGLLIALTLGGLYETSTHIVRGWLRDEAHYDGRPTSYWREHIDGWVSRFDSLADAERHLRQNSPLSSQIPAPPRPTLWGHICLSMNMPGLRSDGEIPPILIADGSAEGVWRELETTGTLGELVSQARRDSAMWGDFRAMRP